MASPDSHCLIGSGEAGGWEVLLGDAAPAPGGLSIFVLSAAQLDPLGSTADFSLVAGFGEFNTDDYTEYVLEPANGSGTLTLEQESREQARIHVTGETADGVRLRATLTCLEVLDTSIRAP